MMRNLGGLAALLVCLLVSACGAILDWRDEQLGVVGPYTPRGYWKRDFWGRKQFELYPSQPPNEEPVAKVNQTPSSPGGTDKELFQGTWLMLVPTQDRSSLRVSSIHFTVHGDSFSFGLPQPRTETWGTFKLDPSSQPKSIDLVIQVPDSKELNSWNLPVPMVMEEWYGIYEVTNDSLTFSFEKKPGDRPKDFDSSHIVWRLKRDASLSKSSRGDGTAQAPPAEVR